MKKTISRILMVAAALAIDACSARATADSRTAGLPQCARGEVDVCLRECNSGRAESCAILGYTFVDGIHVPSDPAKGSPG